MFAVERRRFAERLTGRYRSLLATRAPELPLGYLAALQALDHPSGVAADGGLGSMVDAERRPRLSDDAPLVEHVLGVLHDQVLAQSFADVVSRGIKGWLESRWARRIGDSLWADLLARLRDHVSQRGPEAHGP